MPGNPPMPALLLMRFIIFAACSKRCSSALTAETVTPEPYAMRARREPSMIFGSRRSSGVIERMIASVRSISRSSNCSSSLRCCAMPGIMPSSDFIEPSLRTCCSWAKKSSSPKLPSAIFAAASRVCSSSNSRCACSMSVRMSPMSRMREAMRSGWNTSKSLRLSPFDANRIGLPVTDATESAAPPRASPSSLESTTPVKSTPSSNAWAVRTASWPIIASITNRISFGCTASRMSRACCISVSSTPSRPAVSMITVSYSFCRAYSIESRATFTGSPVVSPGAETASPPVDCTPFSGA